MIFELFFVFFKIGLFTFGGGYAMLPFIQQEVLSRSWVTEEELIDFVAVSESTPGPFAINIATYIGVEKAGILGGIIATTGVVLPSFIIILLIAKFFFRFKENKYVSGVMSGIRPVAIGLIGAAAIKMIINVFIAGKEIEAVIDFSYISSVLIFVFALIWVLKKKSPIAALGISAALGIAVGYISELF